MESLDAETKQKIIDALNEKGVEEPCPRCGTDQWIILEGYLNHPVQREMSGIRFGGPAVPTIALICANCGFISQHAAGILGLLPKRDADDPEQANE